MFTTAVNLPASLWRNLARYAGAHVYSETNDVLVADKSIVAVHSLQPGRRKFTLLGTFRAHDVVSGKEIAGSTSTIEFDLEAPGTRVFRLTR